MANESHPVSKAEHRRHSGHSKYMGLVIPVDSGCQSCSSAGEDFQAGAIQEDTQFEGVSDKRRFQRASDSARVQLLAGLAERLLPVKATFSNLKWGFSA